MITVDHVEDLREIISAWRRKGEHIAFVPTMGNLHQGHLSLIETARRNADRIVVSIFVNPLQFGEGEDFESYPRTLDEDKAQLIDNKVDLLFTPTVGEVYPDGQAQQTRIEVPEISDQLCGASRPGHFTGVATVVCKLFNMVQPDSAVFGKKDFQQLHILTKMTSDLAMPIDIIGSSIVREANGLAMSSRNNYLDTQQRETAALIHKQLQATVESLQNGYREFAGLENSAGEYLTEQGFEVDYFSIRNINTLMPPGADDKQLVILAAAKLGTTRLIDNLTINL